MASPQRICCSILFKPSKKRPCSFKIAKNRNLGFFRTHAPTPLDHHVFINARTKGRDFKVRGGRSTCTDKAAILGSSSCLMNGADDRSPSKKKHRTRERKAKEHEKCVKHRTPCLQYLIPAWGVINMWLSWLYGYTKKCSKCIAYYTRYNLYLYKRYTYNGITAFTQ